MIKLNKTKLNQSIMISQRIILKIFQVVGLDMSNNFHVIDQDTSAYWTNRDKYVKVSCFGFTPIHFEEIRFDPFENKNMVKDLFNIFIAKKSQYENFYIKMMFLDVDKKGKKQLIIMTDEEKIITEKYSHEILCYYDMIFRIGNRLSYDNIEDLMFIDNVYLDAFRYPKKRKGIFDGIYR